MRRAGVLIAAALAAAAVGGLAGCGSRTGATAVAPPVSKLCVDISVPLTGSHAAVGRAVVAGIRMQIPVGGLALGAYRVRLCEIRDDAASRRRTSAQAALTNATQAAGALNTIAEIGELTGADAQTAEAVLAPAGIALLTLSGPVSGTPALPAARGATPQLHNTALYLLPASTSEASALSEVAALHRCARRRRGVNLCTVLGPGRAPLCTAIAATTATTPRYCVMGGPDLAGWVSPAQAYGDGAAKLLVQDLRAVVTAHRDIADRSTVLSTLLRSHLSATASPIGSVRFDSRGAMEADDFSVYTVQPDGGLVLSGSLRTH